MTTTPKRLNVCGSFGFGNAGDEAIPLALTDMAAHLGCSINVQAISRFPKPAMAAVVGIGSEDAARLEALRGNPMLVSGGGIIENTSIATIFRCANLLKKSFAPRARLLGISVEPGVTYGWRQKANLWWHLRRFDTIFTRDVLSEETLKSLLPGAKVETIGDLVLWLRPDANALPDGMTLPRKFVAVVLAPRWGQDRNWLSWLSAELVALCKELNAALVFVPMTGPFDDDRKEHQAVISEMRQAKSNVEVVAIAPWLSPRAIAHVLGQAELVISMRLHGCVMAYAQRVPSVGLIYHPKLLGFFRTVESEHTVLPETVPRMQSGETYGYRFEDLHLKPGQLAEKAMISRDRAEYSKLQEFKTRSIEVFREFLDGIGETE